ncbi:hypothetical protein [Anaeromyxobacter dehalogenans]|uniref:DUF4145 domain-containing protein n=1 Tax=Anaeromyxobacter dehalogenans (strain 2CP-C) TaxID=290397 RepID=Q2IEJ3_ANADE|nr:hypothetical protein [Anaeromyxobacter dehalogenans]ABC82997.1 hypothetical protein Adeh_3229 [Anaeromyxobacter dehalogenans 2CP-C]
MSDIGDPVKAATKGAKHEAPPGLKLSLLSNGIDFIQSGIEHFFLKDDPDPRSHKYAILHLFAGVLLLLKERLRQEHWSLIFKDVARAGESDAKTVDFDEALQRLKSCSKIRISDRDAKLLRKAQLLRNRLEHYEFELNLQESQNLIGRLSEFTYLFLRDNLATDLERHLSPEVWERLRDLREIARRLEQERHEAWLRRTAKYRELSSEDLIAIREELEPYHPKHNPDPVDAQWCDSCGTESLVCVENGIAVCTNPECRAIETVGECMRCYAPVIGGGDLCDGCQDYINSDNS